MENNIIKPKNNKILIIVIAILLILVFALGVLLYLSYNKTNNSKNNTESNQNNNTNEQNNYTYSVEDLTLKADDTLALSEFILNGDNILLSDDHKNEILADHVQSLMIANNYKENYSWSEIKNLSKKVFDGGLSDNALKLMNTEKFVYKCRPGYYNSDTNDFTFGESMCEDFKTYPINVIERTEQDNDNYYLYSRLVILKTYVDLENDEVEDYTEICSDFNCDDVIMKVNSSDYDPDNVGMSYTEWESYLKNEVKDLSKIKEVKYTFAKTTGGIKAVELVK